MATNDFTQLCTDNGLNEELTAEAWAALRKTGYGPGDPEVIRVILPFVLKAEVSQFREAVRDVVGEAGQEAREILERTDEVAQRCLAATATQATEVVIHEMVPHLEECSRQAVEVIKIDSAKLLTAHEKIRKSIIESVCDGQQVANETLRNSFDVFKYRETRRISGAYVGATILIAAVSGVAVHSLDANQIDHEATAKWGTTLTQTDATNWGLLMKYNTNISASLSSWCRAGSKALTYPGGRPTCDVALWLGEPTPPPGKDQSSKSWNWSDMPALDMQGTTKFLASVNPWYVMLFGFLGCCIGRKIARLFLSNGLVAWLLDINQDSDA